MFSHWPGCCHCFTGVGVCAHAVPGWCGAHLRGRPSGHREEQLAVCLLGWSAQVQTCYKAAPFPLPGTGYHYDFFKWGFAVPWGSMCSFYPQFSHFLASVPGSGLAGDLCRSEMVLAADLYLVLYVGHIRIICRTGGPSVLIRFRCLPVGW